MSDLREQVRTAQGLRELAGYVPVDTRPSCPGCGERCCVLWTVSNIVAGRRAEWQECSACRRRKL